MVCLKCMVLASCHRNATLPIASIMISLTMFSSFRQQAVYQKDQSCHLTHWVFCQHKTLKLLIGLVQTVNVRAKYKSR